MVNVKAVARKVVGLLGIYLLVQTEEKSLPKTVHVVEIVPLVAVPQFVVRTVVSPVDAKI